jgi:ferredoxin--NADP+ reductase
MENATIVERTMITPDLMILKIKPDAGVPSFSSGQYIAIGMPGKYPRASHLPAEAEPPVDPEKIIKRAYSIGSSPDEKDALELYIAVVQTGSLTPRLLCTEVGQRIFAAPKIVGTFTLHDVPADKNLVLVSTGTGLAPFISMIRSKSTWQDPARKVTILHGVRFKGDLGYQDEIKDLIQKGLPITYCPVVSRETPTADEFKKGYVQHLFSDGSVTLNPSTDHVFMCGNPSMIDEVESLLLTKGFILHSKKHPGNLHVEKYW